MNQKNPLGPTCPANAKQVGLALLEYAEDYDDVLPPMTNYAIFKTLLYPYTRSTAVFSCPDTSLDYMIDTSLSQHSLGDYPNLAIVEVLRDTQPNIDGSITILYLDGHTVSIFQ